MIKYFRYITKSILGIQCVETEEITNRINKYASENKLKIIQFSLQNDNGIFVLFEKI